MEQQWGLSHSSLQSSVPTAMAKMRREEQGSRSQGPHNSSSTLPTSRNAPSFRSTGPQAAHFRPALQAHSEISAARHGIPAAHDGIMEADLLMESILARGEAAPSPSLTQQSLSMAAQEELLIRQLLHQGARRPRAAESIMHRSFTEGALNPSEPPPERCGAQGEEPVQSMALLGPGQRDTWRMSCDILGLSGLPSGRSFPLASPEQKAEMAPHSHIAQLPNSLTHSKSQYPSTGEWQFRGSQGGHSEHKGVSFATEGKERSTSPCMPKASWLSPSPTRPLKSRRPLLEPHACDQAKLRSKPELLKIPDLPSLKRRSSVAIPRQTVSTPAGLPRPQAASPLHSSVSRVSDSRPMMSSSVRLASHDASLMSSLDGYDVEQIFLGTGLKRKKAGTENEMIGGEEDGYLKDRVALERNRRMRIRVGLGMLRDTVGANGDNAAVLQQAVQYIQSLQQEIRHLRKELNETNTVAL